MSPRNRGFERKLPWLAPVFTLLFGAYSALDIGKNAFISDEPLVQRYAENVPDIELLSLTTSQQESLARQQVYQELRAAGEKVVMAPEIEEAWLTLMRDLVAYGARVTPWSSGVLIEGSYIVPPYDGVWLASGTPADQFSWILQDGADRTTPLPANTLRREGVAMEGVQIDESGTVTRFSGAAPRQGWLLFPRATEQSNMVVFIDPTSGYARVYLHLSGGGLNAESESFHAWVSDQRAQGMIIVRGALYGHQTGDGGDQVFQRVPTVRYSP